MQSNQDLILSLHMQNTTTPVWHGLKCTGERYEEFLLILSENRELFKNEPRFLEWLNREIAPVFIFGDLDEEDRE